MVNSSTRTRMVIHWSAMELAHDQDHAEASVAAIESEAVADECTLILQPEYRSSALALSAH